MKRDSARFEFDIRKRYSGVLKQQGRVQLDADWNEEAEIDRDPMRTALRDVIGACGAPRHASGFAISVERNTLIIGAGRYYVDGLLVENKTDRALEPAGNNLGLVYLDVWERHVNPLELPSLTEVALGGPDTTPRVRTVWQVRVLPLAEPEPGRAERAACGRYFPEWDAIVANPERRMNARVHPATDPDASGGAATPGGYRGLENHLYRVEVHRPGPGAGQGATFKWSRDNGSGVAPHVSDGVPIGRDWVELENGIEVQFSEGTYRTGDYWLIPARTTTRDVEWPRTADGTPEPQRPLEYEHHYCRLAIIALDASVDGWSVVEDCRPTFSPLVGRRTR